MHRGIVKLRNSGFININLALKTMICVKFDLFFIIYAWLCFIKLNRNEEVVMSDKALKLAFSIFTTGLFLLVSGVTLAQDAPSAAVEQGALAWNNWTTADAGGSDTLPDGVANKDYIRCKACHGWDRLGTEGGYVRRSRKDSRPNAGAGDGDFTPRAISGTVTADMILHAGTGRTFADGDGSWVPLNEMMMHDSSNKAQHSAGYTLGNQHPDFSGGELTAGQVDNLVAFLNFADAMPSVHFSNIDTSQTPVLYTIVDTADATAGETFYNDTCFSCHGDPATDHQGANEGHPGGGILAYLNGDGKFSEFAHAARWGIPGTPMTRSTIQSPTSQNITDTMLYLQELGGTGFAINTGLSGNWFNQADRDGEGYTIDIGTNAAGDIVAIIAFYSYDSMSNQAWMLGAGTADGNTVVANLILGEDNTWGDDLVSGGTTATPFGTVTFTFTSCTRAHAAIVPNAAMEGRGFTALEYDVARDITAHATCPIAD